MKSEKEKPAYVFLKRKDPNNVHSNGDVMMNIHNHDTNLTELLLTFEEFLRGCGYHFDGHLEIMDEE